MNNKNKNLYTYSGMTLIELMVALVLASIIITASVSYFSNLITGYRVDTAFRSMRSFLESSRNEAINRKTFVSICQRQSDTECATSDIGWSNGWLMHFHRSADYADTIAVDAEDQIISAQGAISDAVEIKNTGSPYIRFNPNGQSSPNTTISFCVKGSANTRYAKELVVSKGRIRVETKDDTKCNTPTP